MNWTEGVPDAIRAFVETGVVAEFATLSGMGVPIDTPTFYFPSDDLKSIDVATGLVNPAKAERVRRNPKVGMLFAGTDDEPVVALRGHAAVRDADFEANARRYIAETGFEHIGKDMSWAQAREAVQYWTRIIIEITPVEVFWWSDSAAMAGAPMTWKAHPEMALPLSDPAPAGHPTAGSWPAHPWQEIARQAVATGKQPHLAVCDDQGYPMPAPTTRHELLADSFRLGVPEGMPWRMEGKATLSFEGFMIFVGEAVRHDEAVLFKIERALPQNQAVQSAKSVLRLGEEFRNIRQSRLDEELSRRGKTLPAIPETQPARTRLAGLREARIKSGVPITGFSFRN